MNERPENAVIVEFDQAVYDRLRRVTDSPTELIIESVVRRIELEEAIAFTRDGYLKGPA